MTHSTTATLGSAAPRDGDRPQGLIARAAQGVSGLLDSFYIAFHAARDYEHATTFAGDLKAKRGLDRAELTRAIFDRYYT